MDPKKTIKNRLTAGQEKQQYLINQLVLKAAERKNWILECRIKIYNRKIHEIEITKETEILRFDPT